MPINEIPREFINMYDLTPKVKNGYVYTEIQRGMYDLPQVGILANKFLKERLSYHDYFELSHIPGLHCQKPGPIQFTLVVDDFWIKYAGNEHADHLVGILKEFYNLEEDWKGSLYYGITLDWHYNKGYLDISIPTYVHKQVTTYKHAPSK